MFNLRPDSFFVKTILYCTNGNGTVWGKEDWHFLTSGKESKSVVIDIFSWSRCCCRATKCDARILQAQVRSRVTATSRLCPRSGLVLQHGQAANSSSTEDTINEQNPPANETARHAPLKIVLKINILIGEKLCRMWFRYSWKFNAKLHVHFKIWTLKFKLLYLLNHVKLIQ